MSVNSLIHRLAIGLALLIATLATPAWAESVGKLRNLTGVVHIQHTNGMHGLAFEGTELQSGDTIATEKDSSALLAFTDGSQVALRPNTRFQVSEYHYDTQEPQKDHMIVTLFKGGLRTLSGFISKRGNQDAYQLKNGTTATIGIRGTDFTVRVCEDDCNADQRQVKKGAPSSSGMAGRVAQIIGALTATNQSGQKRNLMVGYPFLQGDQLEVSAPGQAALLMTDGTRVVLEAGSRFIINDYHYAPQAPDKGNMVFEMARGAFRVVTGLLAKQRPENVNFKSVVATIGIRGTNFDVVCTPPGPPDDKAPRLHDCDGGLYLSMRDGKTELLSDKTDLVVSKGQTVYLDGPGGTASVLADTPGFMKNNPNPQPETIPLNLEALAGRNLQAAPEGLYAEVNEGRTLLSQNGVGVILDKGESGFAASDGSSPVKLPVTPLFLDADPVLADFQFIPGSCAAP